MNEIHECGDIKALEVKEATGDITEALRDLDHELAQADRKEILEALSQLKLETVNSSFFDVKAGQYVLYTKGQRLEVVDNFDPSCQVDFQPLIPPAGRRAADIPDRPASKLESIPFPHLLAFPEMRSQRARDSIGAQRRSRPDIKDFCAKFSGYHFYYITGHEGVLSQDAWTFIPYLLKENLATEISNGESFVTASGNRIIPPSFDSASYQRHLQSYLDSIESDESPKAVGLHFARTAYSEHIIEEKSKNRSADLNSHSAVAFPNESKTYNVRGTLKRTLNREYATDGARIDWSNPLIDRITVSVNGQDQRQPLSAVLNQSNLGTVTLHDTFIEESFGPAFRKRSLTLTLLTKQGSNPLFTAVSAARLNDQYRGYFQDPAINELQETNFEFHTYRRGESLAEIMTQRLPDIQPYGVDYFKLQQIYYWLFDIQPQSLKVGQEIPVLTSRDDIDKHYETMIGSLAHSHQVIDLMPPESTRQALIRIVGHSLNASETEIAYFFKQEPEVAGSALSLMRGSDPQSYFGQVIKEASSLNQTLSLEGVFFFSRGKQQEVKSMLQDSYARHKQKQVELFEASGIKVPEDFPYSLEFLRAVAPNPRDQIALLVIWKKESGSEAWWKAKIGATRRNGARLLDNLGIKDEASTGEMQTQEQQFRQNFRQIYRRIQDFPPLANRFKTEIEAIRSAINEKKPASEVNELIEDLVLESPEISLIAAQIINQRNIPVAQNIAQLTGTTWDDDPTHQVRILANIYNQNPTQARLIEDYNRWILIADELGVLSEKEDHPPSRFKPGFVEGEYQALKATLGPAQGPDNLPIKYHSRELDSELFKETIERVLTFIGENWTSDNPAIAKVRDQMSLFQFKEKAEKIRQTLARVSPEHLLRRSTRPGNPPVNLDYEAAAREFQSALGIDMNKLPMNAFRNTNPSQAMLKGNYGASGINLLRN